MNLLDDDNYLNNLRENLSSFGYVKIKKFIDINTINTLRSECEKCLTKSGINVGTTSYLPAVSILSEVVSNFILSPQISNLLYSLFPENIYHFTGHSDAHKNMQSFWHKDDGGDKGRKYFGVIPYNKDECRILKVALYLQDQRDASSLVVKKKSHRYSSLSKGDIHGISTEVGDLVVFDARLTHRSYLPYFDPAKEANSLFLSKLQKTFYKSRWKNKSDDDRMALFFSFGIKNKFTYFFAKRNMERQISQHTDNLIKTKLKFKMKESLDNLRGK
jgi:hypothetical protein